MKNPVTTRMHDFVPVGGFATFVNAFAVSAAPRPAAFTDYVAGQGAGRQRAVGIPAPASTPEFPGQAGGEKYQIDLVSAPTGQRAP